MLTTLTNIALFVAAACIFLHFYGEVLLPDATWFRRMSSSILQPTLIATGVLVVLKLLSPSRVR